MQSINNKDKKSLNKIILTVFRWIGIAAWLFLIWAGFDFAIKLI